MKKIIITSLLVCMFTTAVIAQRNMLGVSWNINFPSNDGYLTKTSYAGGKIDYRHFLKTRNASFGLALDWCTYEQYLPRQTFQKPDGSGAVTSDFVAQVYQVPFVATGHYYFETSNKKLQPYIGAGLGAQYLEQSLYYNVYVSDDNNWGFVARPEAGVIIKPQSNWGIHVAAYYSFATNKTEAIDANSFNNFGISFGVAFLQ